MYLTLPGFHAAKIGTTLEEKRTQNSIETYFVPKSILFIIEKIVGQVKSDPRLISVF